MTDRETKPVNLDDGPEALLDFIEGKRTGSSGLTIKAAARELYRLAVYKPGLSERASKALVMVDMLRELLR